MGTTALSVTKTRPEQHIVAHVGLYHFPTGPDPGAGPRLYVGSRDIHRHLGGRSRGVEGLTAVRAELYIGAYLGTATMTKHELASASASNHSIPRGKSGRVAVRRAAHGRKAPMPVESGHAFAIHALTISDLGMAREMHVLSATWYEAPIL